MADEQKKVLLNIESNLDEYQKEAERAADDVARLKSEIKLLSKDSKANRTEIEQKNKSLRRAREIYRNTTKDIDSMSKATKAQTGSYEELQSQLRMAEKNLKTQSGLIIKNADGTIQLTDAYKEASKEVEQARGAVNQFNQGIHDGRTSVGLYSEGITKALGNTGMFGKSIQGATGAVKSMIPMVFKLNSALKITQAAFMALGIGLIVAAIAGLVQMFKRSEEGQNKWNKILAITGQIMDKLMDALATFGETIVKAVNEPREAWERFKDTLQGIANFFSNTFGLIVMGVIDQIIGGYQKMVGTIQLGFERLKGLVTDNSEAIEEAEKKIAEAQERLEKGQEKRRQGVENLVESYNAFGQAVKDAYDEVIDSSNKAGDLSDERARLDRLEREYLVENEKLRKQSADLRAEAEEAKMTNAQESIRLANEAFDIDEKILKNELELLRIRTENMRQQIALSKSDKAALEELAQLEAEYERQQAAFGEQSRTRQRQLNSLRREAFRQGNDLLKAELELQKIYADETIKENERIIKNEELGIERRLIAAEVILSRKADLAKRETELEIQEIQNRLDLNLISEEDAAIQLELIHAKNKQNLLTIQREYNDSVDGMRQAELDAIQKAADEEKAIEKKKEDEIVAYRKLQVNEAIAASSQLLNTMGQFAEEGSRLHKAFAIADAVINTYQGVTKALATLTPPASFITAAATLAQGLAAVRKIATTKPGQASTGGGGTAGGTGFVARRASGAATDSNRVIANVGQNIPTGERRQSSESSSELFEAISKIKPVVTVEAFERVRDRKNEVESKATS